MVKGRILAGGLGTRLREETEFKPKPMVEVGGRPIIWHINEFKNLALRNFILQSQTKGKVLVNSPYTLRTFVDAVDLAGVLFNLGCQDISRKIDSGGQLIEMLNLAERINHVMHNSEADTILGHESSPDYFGKYLEFNSIMTEMGFPFKGIDDQIRNTLKAFTK